MNLKPLLKKIVHNRFLQSLFTVFISLLIALLIGEAIIYLLYRHKMVLFPRYVTDAQYGDFQIRRNIPNAHYWHKSVDGRWEFRVNDQGFRGNSHFDYEKSGDAVRVLVLGDSFTMGYEVCQDETYASVIERYMEKNGVNAEVINAGMSGNSSAEELVFWDQDGVRLQPEVVVLGFFSVEV